MSVMPLVAQPVSPTSSLLFEEQAEEFECEQNPSKFKRLPWWGTDESVRLFEVIEDSRSHALPGREGTINWDYVHSAFPKRTKKECSGRWRRKRGIVERELKGATSRPKCSTCGSGMKNHHCVPVMAVEVPVDQEFQEALDVEDSPSILDARLVWQPATHDQIDRERGEMSWSKRPYQRNECGL